MYYPEHHIGLRKVCAHWLELFLGNVGAWQEQSRHCASQSTHLTPLTPVPLQSCLNFGWVEIAWQKCLFPNLRVKKYSISISFFVLWAWLFPRGVQKVLKIWSAAKGCPKDSLCPTYKYTTNCFLSLLKKWKRKENYANCVFFVFLCCVLESAPLADNLGKHIKSNKMPRNWHF